ncbi:MAG: di-trans,poly-cis-decaprenylcistransferase [Gammaproteobacteria bacterium]|nr:di-trans,poly-cis-decaprenylcistransferase [Gammaproteobacteria bacterium]
MTSDSTSRKEIPGHVAIIMDGNGRWARSRMLPRPAGHQAGVNATRRIVEHCLRAGVEVVTLFAFSSENWRRPAAEVSSLMELFFHSLRREAGRLAENGIRMRFIGDRDGFSPRLKQEIAAAEDTTAAGERMLLNIAANYGGRWDIVQAVRQLIADVGESGMDSSAIDESALNKRLSTAGLAEPDLFIRAGGEHRISNFLLWQLAYTELYFTDTLWPDFDEASLAEAFNDYAGRQRRFGKTGEQVRELDDDA